MTMWLLIGWAINLLFGWWFVLLLGLGAWWAKRIYWPARVPAATGGRQMRFGGFFRAFAGVKGKEVARQVTDALVNLDPKAASAAQLAEMERDLDEAGALLMQTRSEYAHEHQDFAAAQVRFNANVAAAEVLQGKIKAATDNDTAASLQRSLDGLVARLETDQAELAQEKAEVDSAHDLLAEVEAAYTEKADQILRAKKDLESAQRDVARSGVERDRASRRADAAAKVAGLRDQEGNSLTTAIDAMRARAATNRQAAGAAVEKAQALGKGASPEVDANVAAALREAKPEEARSTADRLAALRQ